jgi:hypothetical protein
MDEIIVLSFPIRCYAINAKKDVIIVENSVFISHKIHATGSFSIDCETNRNNEFVRIADTGSPVEEICKWGIETIGFYEKEFLKCFERDARSHEIVKEALSDDYFKTSLNILTDKKIICPSIRSKKNGHGVFIPYPILPLIIDMLPNYLRELNSDVKIFGELLVLLSKYETKLKESQLMVYREYRELFAKNMCLISRKKKRQMIDNTMLLNAAENIMGMNKYLVDKVYID